MRVTECAASLERHYRTASASGMLSNPMSRQVHNFHDVGSPGAGAAVDAAGQWSAGCAGCCCLLNIRVGTGVRPYALCHCVLPWKPGPSGWGHERDLMPELDGTACGHA